MSDRVAPHDLTAERAVLGAVLLEPEMFDVAEAAGPETAYETFYPSPAPANGTIHWDAGQANTGNWTARFFNAQGQQLKESTVPVSGDGHAALSAAGLPAGVIFILLENRREMRRGKVIVGE